MGVQGLCDHNQKNQAEREFLCVKLCSRVRNENRDGLLSPRHFAGLVCAGAGVRAQRSGEGIWRADG